MLSRFFFVVGVGMPLLVFRVGHAHTNQPASMPEAAAGPPAQASLRLSLVLCRGHCCRSSPQAAGKLRPGEPGQSFPCGLRASLPCLGSPGRPSMAAQFQPHSPRFTLRAVNASPCQAVPTSARPEDTTQPAIRLAAEVPTYSGNHHSGRHQCLPTGWQSCRTISPPSRGVVGGGRFIVLPGVKVVSAQSGRTPP